MQVKSAGGTTKTMKTEKNYHSTKFELFKTC